MSIALVITLCSLANTAACKDVVVKDGAPSVIACTAAAPALIAEWAKENAKAAQVMTAQRCERREDRA